jgi:hypothetical protein
MKIRSSIDFILLRNNVCCSLINVNYEELERKEWIIMFDLHQTDVCVYLIEEGSVYLLFIE